jgi:PAS domain-containing protein
MKSFEIFALHLLRDLRCPVVVVNDRLEILSANPSGWDFLGGAPETLRGLSLDCALIPNPRQDNSCPLPSTEASGNNPWAKYFLPGGCCHSGLSVLCHGQKPAGHERVVMLEVSPIEGGELLQLANTLFKSLPEVLREDPALPLTVQRITPVNYILLFRDITEETHRERLHRESMKRTLDAVVLTLDHYIRNALTPILGYSQLMASRGDEINELDAKIMLRRIADHAQLIVAVLDALKNVRQVQLATRYGADSVLIDIERDLQARLDALKQTGCEMTCPAECETTEQ